MLKRLMNVLLIVWIAYFLFTLKLTFAYEDMTMIEVLIKFLAKKPEYAIPSLFGWVFILLLNYIFTSKFTLWHKANKS